MGRLEALAQHHSVRAVASMSRNFLSNIGSRAGETREVPIGRWARVGD